MTGKDIDTSIYYIFYCIYNNKLRWANYISDDVSSILTVPSLKNIYLLFHIASVTSHFHAFPTLSFHNSKNSPLGQGFTHQNVEILSTEHDNLGRFFFKFLDQIDVWQKFWIAKLKIFPTNLSRYFHLWKMHKLNEKP